MGQTRVVLITGAAGGLGRAMAIHMAKQGFQVGLMDKSPDVESVSLEISEAGFKSTAVVADLTDPQEIERAVRKISDTFGPIDCLINNAGVTDHISPLLSMDMAKWQKEIEINLNAPLYLIKATLPSMIERKWGRIVNISSQAARGGLIFQAGYATTKAGLLGITRSVTLEHARHGITCNAVLPGLIETTAVSKLPSLIRKHALSITPARRTGTPEEVAHLVSFLCSDGAGYINGSEIDIDGGSHLCQVVLSSTKEINERSV